MLTEAREAPERVAEQLQANAEKVQEVASAMRASPPNALLTVARGSSDHASAYVGYHWMAAYKRPVTSVPSSLVNLFAAPAPKTDQWAFAYSQSGQSPDLVKAMQHFSTGGSPTLAWVNVIDSPLAKGVRYALDLYAGPEKSVAATKSYLAQLSAGLHLQSAWLQDADLSQALHTLSDHMRQALSCDWGAFVELLKHVNQLYVLGRGSAWALAQEAALKFKEVCGIHAEAFSSAEVMHGPMALVRPGFVVLVFAPRGPAQASALATAQALRERGATVFVAASEPHDIPAAARLPIVACEHEAAEGICLMQSFYVMVEALARARGLDPDSPAHLAKVTLTH
jgi:glucosamine--fructose-6-phosphate aminotransferase (isomerizing)